MPWSASICAAVTWLALPSSNWIVTTAGETAATARPVPPAEPALPPPALNRAATAAGYGVKARRVDGLDELRSELATAIASSEPELIEVGVEPGMALF